MDTSDMLNPETKLEVQVFLTRVLSEISELYKINDELTRRLERFDVNSLENVDNVYQYFKHSVDALEPTNTFTPNQNLENFFEFIRALMFGIAAGVSGIFGLLLSRMFIRLTESKPT